MPGPIYVDAQGYATDDENNRWFVGLPEGNYPASRLPQTPIRPSPRTLSEEAVRETDRILLAAAAAGEVKFVQFMLDVYRNYTFSEKQLRFRALIESRLKNLIGRMPFVKLVDTHEKRPDLLKVDRLSDTDRRRLEPFFLVETGFDGRSTLRSFAFNPELRRKGPAPLHQAQADAIRKLLDRTGNNFLRTVLQSLDAGKTPTTRQMEVVRKIFQENLTSIPDVLR